MREFGEQENLNEDDEDEDDDPEDEESEEDEDEDSSQGSEDAATAGAADEAAAIGATTMEGRSRVDQAAKKSGGGGTSTKKSTAPLPPVNVIPHHPAATAAGAEPSSVSVSAATTTAAAATSGGSFYYEAKCAFSHYWLDFTFDTAESSGGDDSTGNVATELTQFWNIYYPCRVCRPLLAMINCPLFYLKLEPLRRLLLWARRLKACLLPAHEFETGHGFKLFSS